MKKTAALICLVATVSCVSFSQYRDAIERHALLLKSMEGCLEGYAGTVGGETIRYPRLNTQFPEALLTRATTGAMAIEWITEKTPNTSGSRRTAFVVSAGVFAQPEAGKKFRMYVNDVPRFEFSASRADAWTVKGDGGGALTFRGVMRDQHNDVFGYLEIALPAEWLAAGSAARIKVVGEKAGSREWFMVFKDPAVLPFLREKADNEAYCDLLLSRRDEGVAVEVTAPSEWAGRQLKITAGRRTQSPVTMARDSGFARAKLRIEASPSDSLRILVDTMLIAHVPGVMRESDESRITPKKIVSLKIRNISPAVWKIEYRSSYAPEFGTSLIALSDASKGSGTQLLISSSHQDIAWMDTPAQCVIDRDTKVITPALTMMRENPDFRFDLEDVLTVREYLERHPDRKEELGRRLAEGRLGVGASYTMPYEDLCSGEMLVRQFYAGRKWLKDTFPGCDTRVAWNPDVPGRSLQSLQIMRKSGVKYLVISRHERGLYDWYSPDGSSVLTYSPHHYGLYAENTAGKQFPEAATYLASSAITWMHRIPNGSTNIPVLSMSDMSAPANVDGFLNTWNALKSIEQTDGKPLSLSLPPIRYSTAEEFFRSVSSENLRLPEVRGERPNIWLYIHGPTHHRAISAKREADVFLPGAEAFATVDALLSRSTARYPQKILTEAWESLIYPDHGWGGKHGEITDSIFLAKYENARDMAKEIQAAALSAIAGRIRTAPRKGIPVVVFNSLSWKRTSPVRFNVTFPSRAFRRGLLLADAAGKPAPVQLISRTRYGDGSLRSAEILFVADGVPPMGYATYYLQAAPTENEKSEVNAPAPDVLENRFYKVTLGTGGVSQIADKELGADLLDNRKFLGGELFTMQSVGEDAGEWSEPQQPTMEGFDRLKSHAPEWRLVESGAVRQVVETRQRLDHVTVVQRVGVYRELKQIDFEVDLLQWDGTKYREFRLGFPVKMPRGQVSYEVPFGALEVGKDEMKGAAGERYTQEVSSVHPRSVQNWIGASDDRLGVTISSSVAVWDYLDPTGPSEGVTLLQPILLASRRSCHGEGNWYLQEGDHHFRFALTSHLPGWRNGRRFGVAANVPLAVVNQPSAMGERNLPEELSFFSSDADNVVLSAMKLGEDGHRIVLRLWECEGKDATPTLRLHWPLRAAEMTNMIEEEGTPAALVRGGVKVPMGHHSIQTLAIILPFKGFSPE